MSKCNCGANINPSTPSPSICEKCSKECREFAATIEDRPFPECVAMVTNYSIHFLMTSTMRSQFSAWIKAHSDECKKLRKYYGLNIDDDLFDKETKAGKSVYA